MTIYVLVQFYIIYFRFTWMCAPTDGVGWVNDVISLRISTCSEFACPFDIIPNPIPGQIKFFWFSFFLFRLFRNSFFFLLHPQKHFSSNTNTKRYDGSGGGVNLKPYQPIIFKWHIHNGSQSSNGKKAHISSWVAKVYERLRGSCVECGMDGWRVLHCEDGNERSTLINILKLYACHWVVDARVERRKGCRKGSSQSSQNFSRIYLIKLESVYDLC